MAIYTKVSSRVSVWYTIPKTKYCVCVYVQYICNGAAEADEEEEVVVVV